MNAIRRALTIRAALAAVLACLLPVTMAAHAQVQADIIVNPDSESMTGARLGEVVAEATEAFYQNQALKAALDSEITRVCFSDNADDECTVLKDPTLFAGRAGEEDMLSPLMDILEDCGLGSDVGILSYYPAGDDE